MIIREGGRVRRGHDWVTLATRYRVCPKCRGGSCGECETRVLACDQELIHNDHYLTPDERRSSSKIVICVSRAEGGKLVLDL
jgi:hypothetical protein